jgi:hypothetical protein
MSLSQHRARSRTLAILVALTALHATYRWTAAGSRTGSATRISTLAIGDVLLDHPSMVATDRGWVSGRLLVDAPCQVVVAFDPACPYCERAAQNESAKLESERLPTTWMAPPDSAKADRYRPVLGASTRVVRSRDAWEFLKIGGVPAAFLIDARGSIRRMWPYRALELRSDLEGSCATIRSSGSLPQPRAQPE